QGAALVDPAGAGAATAPHQLEPQSPSAAIAPTVQPGESGATVPAPGAGPGPGQGRRARRRRRGRRGRGEAGSGTIAANPQHSSSHQSLAAETAMGQSTSHPHTQQSERPIQSGSASQNQPAAPPGPGKKKRRALYRAG